MNQLEPKLTTNISELDQLSFLKRNNISTEDWEKAKIQYGILQKIGLDHLKRSDDLSESAAFFARTIQKFEAVHSVRWRIKNPEHLMEKIVRKRAAAEVKYQDISPENYHEKVTDLVGIRAIHLFKEDCFAIDAPLRSTWTLVEDPVVYVRDGDPEEITSRLNEAGFTVKRHPAGYRSVHYVFASEPTARKVYAEVQVRTIFEEGWSEIDHRIRYPNFSDNPLVGFFLAIFNRMAGSADEMGAFVKNLVVHLNELQSSLEDERRQKQSILNDMEAALEEWSTAKQEDEKSKDIIRGLQSQIKRLEQNNRGALSTMFSNDEWSKAFQFQADIDKTLAEYKEKITLIDLLPKPLGKSNKGSGGKT